jgi:acyl carrier protein
MSEVTDKIFSKVRECLAQALGLDEDEITRNSSLTEDLGAESIDFLDILFRLEQAFGIKIPRTDLFPEQFMANTEYVKDSKVTAAGMKSLKEKFPFTDYSDFEKDPLISKLVNTFTVNSLVGYLGGRLAAENIKV